MLALAIAAFAGCAIAGDAPPAPPWMSPLDGQHPLAGGIWAPAAARFLEPSDVVDGAVGATFVLLGEKHDNVDHHRLQAWLTGLLIERGRRPAVAFEMFGGEQSEALADYQRAHPGDAAGLGTALGWEQSGWPDWKFYAPIAEAAARARLPIIAANLPQGEAQALARGRPASPELRDRLGLDVPLADELVRDLAQEIRDSHCGQLPEDMIAGMVLAQRARDAAMAAAMAAQTQRGADGAVLIAGAGHVRTDRGVPLHLRRIAPQDSAYSVAFLEVQAGKDLPTEYGDLPFDAVWFTPRLDDNDPCTALRERFRKK